MLFSSRLTSLALTIAVVIGAPLAQAAGAAPAAAPAASAPANAANMKAPLPLDELRTFAEVMDRIKAAYVEPVDDKTLLENAIKGMLSNLDPHSAYLGPEDFQELQESTSGEFGGLGITITVRDGRLTVEYPLEDTPAFEAGLKPDDIIMRIDGESTINMSLDDAVSRLRGPVGSEVVIHVLRKGMADPLRIPIIRDLIKLNPVEAQLLAGGRGVLRIAHGVALEGRVAPVHRVEEALDGR